MITVNRKSAFRDMRTMYFYIKLRIRAIISESYIVRYSVKCDLFVLLADRLASRSGCDDTHVDLERHCQRMPERAFFKRRGSDNKIYPNFTF